MHPDNGRWQGRGGAKGQKSCEYCLLLLPRSAQSPTRERALHTDRRSERLTTHDSPISQGSKIHMSLSHPKSSSSPTIPPLPFPSDPQFVISISPLSRRYCEKPAFLPLPALLLCFTSWLPPRSPFRRPNTHALRRLRYDAVNSMQTNVQESSLFPLLSDSSGSHSTRQETKVEGDKIFYIQEWSHCIRRKSPFFSP